MSNNTLPSLDQYDIDPERGFLPAHDPLTSLPGAFTVWEEVATDLPRLIPTQHLRSTIESLPPFPIEALATDEQWRRAQLILSCLGHAYIWQGSSPAIELPAVLAVPWHTTATYLGRHPVLSYASYALENWSRIDPEGPIALGNLAKSNNFLGGLDETWFVMVHVHIEAHAAHGVVGAYEATTASLEGDAKGVLDGLGAMSSSLEEMNSGIARMSENCDAYIYYHRVRQFIHGWKNHPALPDGVLYQGVEAYNNTPQQFRGETGAQSALVPTFDSVLNIDHSNDSMRPYLIEMREYMPPAHRRFIEDLEEVSNVRSIVEESADSELKDTYNHCIEELAAFRTTHLNFAKAFIYDQSERSKSNPIAVGTAGTPFVEYLQKHTDETLKHRL